MIVRTYGRRSRSMARSYSDAAGYDDDGESESFRDSFSQETPSQDIYNFSFSSQDSSHWSFDSDPFAPNSSQESRQLPPRVPLSGGNLENADGGFRKPKKPKNGKRESEVPKKLKKPMRSESAVPSGLTTTATLMETQECGEMMEHVDEVNFALDGLRKGQPARIRRASLLSLLSVCSTAQQRRLLRAHGMAKTIIAAVLGLSFDDSASNLAAAALFYILTSDCQDDHLLDSPNCILFLIKLLKPVTSDATKNKTSTIGCKLLALRKDSDIFQDAAKGVDSTSAAITLKVQEILMSCKEMKSRDGNGSETEKPELSPKWIALLTMEKACLSTIAMEDTTGAVRRTGGKFKEKLRELGGLDAVFDVARNCHTIMEGWLKQNSSSSQFSNDNTKFESLVVLLKCLKVMENATFLSEDNQGHLLGMKGSFAAQASPRTFIKLIISVIRILSGLSLVKSSPGNSNKDELYYHSNGTAHALGMPLMQGHKADSNEIISISSSLRSTNIEWSSSQTALNFSQNSQWSTAGCSKSSSETPTTTFLADNCLLKMRVDSSASGSCSGKSSSGKHASSLKMNLAVKKKPKVAFDDSQDPFAFDDGDFEPSKWDLMSGNEKKNSKERRPSELQSQNNSAICSWNEDSYESQLLITSQQESSSVENHNSQDVSCSSAVDEEKSNLLAECLLTSVKVLMNLTNDNPLGCQQIAACGGLETLSSLIADHFPSFSSSLPPFSDVRENITDQQIDKHLTDQELDFLVAILGLLVNLVEKDSGNRSRLATSSVSLPCSGGGSEKESRKDVIPLLCSIFLANQGAGEAAGEAAGEGKCLTWDDEEALMQGEKEAEKMIVEAYSALLLAFLSTESKSTRKDIAECLPDNKLATLVPVLERFVEFHLTLNMISPETHTAVLEVIESCRVP